MDICKRDERVKIGYIAVCAAMLIATVLCSVFKFPQVFARFIESVCDIGSSFKYYFFELGSILTGEENTARATVTEISDNVYSLLPIEWEEFKARFVVFGKKLIEGDNFTAFWAMAVKNLSFLSLYLTLAIDFIAFVLLLNFGLYKDKNAKDPTKDSIPLRIYKRALDVVYYPVKKFVCGYIAYIKDDKAGAWKKVFVYGLVVLWLYNINALTVVLELISYLIYFSNSFDVLHLYTLVVKTVMDLSVIFTEFPAWVLTVAGLVLFGVIRKKIAVGRLKELRKKSMEFLKTLGVVVLVHGMMKSGKTLQMTYMAKLYDRMFREEAKAGLLRNDLRFRGFPWDRFEKKIDELKEKHVIYDLYTCEAFVKANMKILKYTETLRKLSKRGKVQFITDYLIDFRKEFTYKEYDYYLDPDFFGYDYKRYGEKWNDGINGIELEKALIYYAKYYYIYSLDCAEILSNYSIRWDLKKKRIKDKDEGYFPLWEDSIRFAPRADEQVRYTKIIDFECFRLGKHMKPEKGDFVYEFGGKVITEIDKERGNQNTKIHGAPKDACTQSNDGYNQDAKLRRHSCTVEYSTFAADLNDCQRPADWEAAGSEMSDKLRILSGQEKSTLLLHQFDDLFMQIFAPLYGKYYAKKKNLGHENTLQCYLIRHLFGLFSDRYERLVNRYYYREQKMEVYRQGQKVDEKLKCEKFYIPYWEVRGAYRTDCYSGVYAERAARSKIGLGDVPEYQSDMATWAEYESQNSFLINEIGDSIVNRS